MRQGISVSTSFLLTEKTRITRSVARITVWEKGGKFEAKETYLRIPFARFEKYKSLCSLVVIR